MLSERLVGISSHGACYLQLEEAVLRLDEGLLEARGVVPEHASAQSLMPLHQAIKSSLDGLRGHLSLEPHSHVQMRQQLSIPATRDCIECGHSSTKMVLCVLKSV